MGQLLIGFIFCLLVILLITTEINASLLFIGAVCVCLFLGFIDTNQLLDSFTNEALIALILLLQVSAVIERSAFIPILSRQIFVPGKRGWSIFRMSSLSIILSSHLNNTAVVASLMGIIQSNKHFVPSKFLIPLSYSAIMGGVLTLIGTSTNLIINSFMVEEGMEPLGFYDFIYVGIPLVLIGGIYLLLILPRLLPYNTMDEEEEEKKFFLEVRVSQKSRLIGKSIEENGLRNMDHLFLAEIIRNNQLISPVTPDEKLEERDRLVFTGDINQIQELRKFDGLEILEEGMDDILKSNLQEVVIRHNSPVIGRKIKDAQFRTKFDAVVVALNRGKEDISGKLGQVVLRPGDSLVLAVGQEFAKHQNISQNFILISPVEAESAYNFRESYLAVGIFLLSIVMVAFQVMSLLKAMLLDIFIFLILGLLKTKDLKNNLNLPLFLMIGSSLGLSKVLVNQGIASKIGMNIINLTGMDNPYLTLFGIYITTVVLTELVTNSAAAALVFPIALVTANQLNVSPMPFIMIIAYAASASFMTPIGYQTNTMVWSVGKYKFTDYIKAGTPLAILYGIVVMLLVPYFFPF
ncbi:MAG: SLC13 family permease [Bacteroidota bacterium]